MEACESGGIEPARRLRRGVKPLMVSEIPVPLFNVVDLDVDGLDSRRYKYWMQAEKSGRCEPRSELPDKNGCSLIKLQHQCHRALELRSNKNFEGLLLICWSSISCERYGIRLA